MHTTLGRSIAMRQNPSPESKSRIEVRTQVVNPQQQLAPHAVAFPSDRIRSLFSALHQKPSFIFFDNAAGAQIPQVVFDAINGQARRSI